MLIVCVSLCLDSFGSGLPCGGPRPLASSRPSTLMTHDIHLLNELVSGKRATLKNGFLYLTVSICTRVVHAGFPIETSTARENQRRGLRSVSPALPFLAATRDSGSGGLRQVKEYTRIIATKSCDTLSSRGSGFLTIKCTNVTSIEPRFYLHEATRRAVSRRRL